MWKDLTMSQRADMMDLYLSKGITSLDDMRSLYDSSISDTAQGTSFSDGGSIRIDPSKKGTFTAAAKKHGMGVQEFASRVLANKENYSPAMVKKANFARNSSKWHGYGGHIYDGLTEDDQLMNAPYAGELPDVTVMPRRISNKSWDKVQERWVGDVPTYYAVNPETGKEEMLREIGNGKYSTYDDKHVFDVLGAEAAKKEREQWIKNGGNTSDFDKVMLGTLGLGLAPIALPEIAAGVSTALANPYVDAGLTSYFGAHGLNHAINEGIDGWGDAAMTALEVAPLGRLVKPIYEGVVQPGMRLFNSPLTGNWTTIGNRQYRLSPNSLGANGSSVEQRIPQITAENAASITPEQWTVAQDAAIARGNMAEAQRLRDLHFKVSAPNTKQPAPMFNASGKSTFNEFNGGDTGLNWFSESEKYAANHGVPRAFYINEPNIYFGNVPAWVKGTPVDERYIESLRRLGYSEKQIAQKVQSINEAANSNTPAAKSIGMGANNELVTKNNNTAKLADAVTYDDNGIRISLGERDNFNINDIRYGLLPFGIGLTGYGLYNLSKEK